MTALERLQERTGSDWTHLRRARIASTAVRSELNGALQAFSSADTSIVIVGSLAREEFTPGSDIDWTLILDGMSRPQDEQVARDIRNVLDSLKRKQPGREGVFGTLASSHDLIHRIGGQDDTNANTTRRILLLLESIAIGRDDAHSRVLNNILYRYLDEDRGLWFGSSDSKVPHFLFNDVARYWRTMAVDFAYKQRTRPEGGFLLRNTKLRTSRKLLFLAGMLTCFHCHTGFESSEHRREYYNSRPIEAVIDKLRNLLTLPPLEIVATSLLPFEELDSSSKKIFTAYDEFVGMLSDETSLIDGRTKRQHLDFLPVENIDGDPIAAEARDISHRFRDGISEIFLTPKTQLGRLTIEYGVF